MPQDLSLFSESSGLARANEAFDWIAIRATQPVELALGPCHTGLTFQLRLVLCCLDREPLSGKEIAIATLVRLQDAKPHTRARGFELSPVLCTFRICIDCAGLTPRTKSAQIPRVAAAVLVEIPGTQQKHPTTRLALAVRG